MEFHVSRKKSLHPKLFFQHGVHRIFTLAQFFEIRYTPILTISRLPRG
jgi:hypothetical protein